MTSLNISLSEKLREFVISQASHDGYTSPSEFLSALIVEERRRRARLDLDDLLDAALQGGPATPMTRDDWDTLEARVRVRQPTAIG